VIDSDKIERGDGIIGTTGKYSKLPGGLSKKIFVKRFQILFF